MARIPDTDLLLRCVPKNGDVVGNYFLMNQLQWDADKYWRVREKLLDDSLLVLGTGRGGSVRLARPKSVPVPQVIEEKNLYKPILKVLESAWRQHKSLHELHVEITANQGSKVTGGAWSRPDLIAISSRVFRHLPGKKFDLWTFEVKNSTGLNVASVLEAVAHSRWSHRSYLLVQLDREDVLNEQDSPLKRCIEEAQRFRVGLITFTDSNDFSTWDIRTEAERREPDEELVEEMISTQLSDKAKDYLAKWFKN